MKSRPTELIINIKALQNNYEKIKKCQPEKQILPVLKAGGYGIGLEAVNEFIKREKIDIIGTAIVDEGIIAREKLKFKGDIVVINQPAIEEIPNIVEYELTSSCCYIEFLKELNNKSFQEGKISKVHVEIETGMGRTGIQIQNLESFILEALKLKNIEIEGVFTHFATSDSDLEYTKKQIEIFEKAVELIKTKIPNIKYIHCGNSAAIIQMKDLPGNMVRPGIILYGHFPSENLKNTIELDPVSILKSKITFLKEVEKGTSISYNRTYITTQKTKIANVPIGYADGIPRSLSNKGHVIIKGKKAPIVGTICMDSFMVDVTDIPNVKIGNEVFIWDNKIITLEEIAKECGTINYEILSTISDRVVRKAIN